MSDKVTPPSKPVTGNHDGMNMPSEYRTITTPDPSMGRYYGSGKPASETKESDSLFGKK